MTARPGVDVTNGTRGLDLPEADLILVSLDGTREDHDRIRGHTHDRVLASIVEAPSDNLCLIAGSRGTDGR
jgi:hypothetical protein